VKRRRPGTPAVIVITAVAGLCLVSSINRSAQAEEAASPQAAIDTRRAGFKKMGAATKALSEQLKNDSPEPTKVAGAAQAIMTVASEVPHWFPAGTDNGSGLDTDALPYIWKERGKFDALASQLVTESKSLAASAVAGDLTTVRSQTKTVESVCKNCHSSFRAD
jgi:cytochrome c556